MKFMQRKQQLDLRAQMEEEQRRAELEAQWVMEFDDLDEFPVLTNKVQEESSYLPFTDIMVIGRKSYQSFNKRIQDLAKEQERIAKLQKAEGSITDKEMVERFAKDVGLSMKRSGSQRESTSDSAPRNSNPSARPTSISANGAGKQQQRKKPRLMDAKERDDSSTSSSSGNQRGKPSSSADLRKMGFIRPPS
ncbi:hypothetical protein HK102_002053 [Quaeritorhiza haematococci]|nr:hypothetical protein HK102_002053 [Quaeritorhiza haematococci]